ncbi:hypothetical protein PISL3812_01329 [Talaromyces islandicus]|uniref:Uncharacterized protein n=1 Tax=Talaromyces islandicus TaxID=28573 RepID=A0A0U1LLU3_TALIS|nr:hypothetical protein PISL3812_01329 [Talaromyces islandicus]
MMVPRSFLFSSSTFHNAPPAPEEKRLKPTPPTKKTRALPLVNEPVPVTAPPAEIVHTNPVVIPPKHTSNNPYLSLRATRNARSNSATARISPSEQTLENNLPSSLATLLQTTSIPRRSRSVRNPRKLPPGNHVEDFSRLLMEGVRVRDDSASLDASVSSPLDSLLSPPDEEFDKSDIASHSGHHRPSSVRSASSDSMPSLDHDLNSLIISSPTTPSSIHRRAPDRRKQLSPPQECATDHPLLESELESFDSCFESLESTPAPLTKSRSFRTFPRLGSTFKSNLTASLRAIKSAAQTVSNFATPSVQPDDFLTRSLFSIAPELTDDRRPLPMNEPPSPALRRYLNPITLSPAEMYVYNEPRQEVNRDLNSTPTSIQMQTYNRSGHSSRRGRFSTGGDNSQQAIPFDPEVPSSRQREPRENSDFLRMVVLEMNMRRRGKLRDDIPTRAKIWLPPRKTVRLVAEGEAENDEEPVIPQRWIGISIEYTQ